MTNNRPQPHAIRTIFDADDLMSDMGLSKSTTTIAEEGIEKENVFPLSHDQSVPQSKRVELLEGITLSLNIDIVADESIPSTSASNIERGVFPMSDYECKWSVGASIANIDEACMQLHPGAFIKKLIENVTYDTPCKQFPHNYLVNLFVRLRIF